MGLCILVYLFQKPCWEDAVLDCCCFQFVVLCWFALWYVLFNKIMFITKELHTVSVSVHWEEHSGHLQLNQTSWKSWSTFSKSLLTDLFCQSVWIISYFSVCGAETESFVRPSAHLPAAEWNLHLYASSSGQHPLPSKSSQWLWGVSLHSCFTSAACCFQKDEDKLWGRKRMWWQVISKQA